MSELELEKITYGDFPNVCRTCLGTSDILPISETLVTNIEVDVLLEFGVGVTYDIEDLLPQNICQECLTNLYNVYVYKNLCQQNVKYLESLLKDCHKKTRTAHLPGLKTIKNEDTDLTDIKVKVKESETGIVETAINLTEDEDEESLNGTKMEPEENSVKGEKRIFLCDKCPKSFTTKAYLDSHQMSHSNKLPYLCDLCGKKFRWSSSLKSHEKTHKVKGATEEIVTFGCDECGRVFKSPSLYKFHLSKHFEPQEPNELICRICQRQFNNLHSLKYHIYRHDGHTVFCDVCKKGFRHKFELKEHYNIHTGQKPFKCKLCTKSYPYKASLRSHMLVHTKKRPFKCPACSATFSQSQHYRRHLRLHTGEKLHKCTYCDKSFAERGNLVVHIRRHTMEKPFVCNICGRGFPDTSSMKRHRNKHDLTSVEDQPTDEKPLPGSEIEETETAQ